MLPKSSARVSEVIKLANKIAREYELEYVGTEHMLLAVMEEGTGIGAAVLNKKGVNVYKMREEVENLVKQQMEETWVFGRLPGTPHFKNVMATAIEECQKVQGKELCTEHILLALLKEQGCTANKALTNLGILYDDIHQEILNHSPA